MGENPADDDGASTTVDTSGDAQVVSRLVAGDTSAMADLYDRWADRVHSVCARVLDGNADEAADAAQDTFLIAVDKIEQLRDPTRVGPWLLAIARHEAIRRGKRRAKERAVDTTEPANPISMSDEAATVDDVSDIDRADVVGAAYEAIGSLNGREAALVELHLVQGLTGKDLAAAAGIAHDQLHVAVNRMKDRLSSAVTSLYVARHGRGDCPELADVLGGWDGAFTSVIRKRVTRHTRGCDRCNDRARRTNPVAAAALLPIIPAPTELRRRLISAVSPTGDGAAAAVLSPGAGVFGFDREGFPLYLRGGRKVLWWLFGAPLAVLLLLGGAVAFNGDGGGDDGELLATAPQAPTSTVPPTSSTTTTSTTSTSSTSTTTTTPTTASTSTTAAPAPPPPPPTPSSTASTTTTTASTTTTQPNSPPTVDIVEADAWAYTAGAENCRTVSVYQVAANDEESTVVVRAELWGPGGSGDVLASTTLAGGDPYFDGVLGPLSAGDVEFGNQQGVDGTLWVEAEDADGATSTSTQSVEIYAGECPY